MRSNRYQFIYSDRAGRAHSTTVVLTPNSAPNEDDPDVTERMIAQAQATAVSELAQSTALLAGGQLIAVHRLEVSPIDITPERPGMRAYRAPNDYLPGQMA